MKKNMNKVIGPVIIGISFMAMVSFVYSILSTIESAAYEVSTSMFFFKVTLVIAYVYLINFNVKNINFIVNEIKNEHA